MNEKDIQIVQDTKILQQILKTIPENMHNQINVIMVNQVNHGNGNGEDFELERYLESLQPPRLQNMINKCLEVAKKKFITEGDAANWLGGSRRLFNYRRQKTLKSVELIE